MMKIKHSIPSLKEQVGGADIVFGKHADPSTLNLMTLSAEQSSSLIKQIEREHLLDAYAEGDFYNAPRRLAELLLQIFDTKQIDDMKSPKLSIITGINPGAKYKPRSYAGQKVIPKANDIASTLSSLLIEAVILVTGQTLVRVPGTQYADDPSHRISTVAQIVGHEKKLSSGSISTFGFHGDTDGMNQRIVDSLVLCNQVNDGFVPTLYANLLNVMNSIHKDSDDWQHIEALELPVYTSEPPVFVGDRNALFEGWARPLIRSQRSDFYLHPTSMVHPDIDDEALIERCNKALEWVRYRLAETAFGVSLRPYQLGIFSNTVGKHAVWQKPVGTNGLSLRQFMRGYGTKSVSIPGASYIEAPLS